LLVIADIDQNPGQRSGQSANCNSGEQHGCGGCSAAIGGDAIQKRRGPQTAENCCNRNGKNRQRRDRSGEKTVAENNHRDRGKRGAGRDADQSRIRQRIAKQPLHHRAGRRQRSADQKSKENAWQANIDQNDMIAQGKAFKRFCAQPVRYDGGNVDMDRAERNCGGPGNQAQCGKNTQSNARPPCAVTGNPRALRPAGKQPKHCHGVNSPFEGPQVFHPGRPARGKAGAPVQWRRLPCADRTRADRRHPFL